MKNNLVFVGKILSTHGLKGGVKVASFCSEPEDIFRYDLLDENSNTVKLEKVGNTSKSNIFIVRFNNIDSIEEVEKYKNLELYADNKDFSSLEDDEFYVNDIMEMKVNGDGKIGIIENFYNYGAGDVIEVKWEDNKLESIPFTDDFIKNINKEDDTIYVNLPKYI